MGLWQTLTAYSFAWALGAFVPCLLYFTLLDQVLLQVSSDPKCQFFLDETFFGVPNVHEYLTCLGEQGRALYLLFYRVDLVLFPVVYGLLLHHLLKLVRCRQSPCKWKCTRWLCEVVLPSLTVVVDVMENSLIVLLVRNFPMEYPVLGRLVGRFTQLKYVMVGICLAAMLLGLAQRIWTRCCTSTQQRHDKSA